MAKIQADNIKWILDLDVKGVQAKLHGLSSDSQRLMIENKKLEAEMKQVSKAMQEAEKDMEKLIVKGDRTSDTYQKAKIAFDQNTKAVGDLNKQIEANKRQIDQNNEKARQLTNTLKVEEMTMEQLRAKAKELELQLNKTSKSASPAAYETLNKELKEVKDRMGELKDGGEETSSVFGGGISRTFIGFAAVIGTVKVGLDTFEGIMMSNRGTAVEFTAVMDGLSASFDYFKTSVANWDFSSFWDNVKNAFTAGSEASKMFENVHNMQNSFKLTSAAEIAEIEDLKTQLRDVNKTNAERLKIGEQIIEKTKRLSDEEKKMYDENLKAAKRKLDSQAEFTEEELNFILVNRNAQQENIKSIEAIQKEEKELNRLIKNRDFYEQHAGEGRTHYNKQVAETTKEIEKHRANIQKIQKDAGFDDPKQYEIMTSAVKKFANTDKEAVDAYVEARVRMNEVDIKTTRGLRETERMMSTLTKKDITGGKTQEQRERDALNELNKNIEIKHQNDLTEIKEKYQKDGFNTDAEYNRKLVALESTSYGARKLLLEQFLENITDPKVKQEVLKQIADLDNKILDQEIKVKKEIEKILLDADPVEKENRQYQERLAAVGIFLDKELELTGVKKQAFELLEAQHQANLKKIREQGEAMAKADSEAKFKETFSETKDRHQTELNELLQNAASMSGNSYDAEMAVHMKRLEMIHAEVAARKAAGLETSRQLQQLGSEEAKMTTTIQKETSKRAQQYTQYTTAIGASMGDFLSGQKDGLEAFGGTMIDILFDILTQIINQKIVEATAVAVAEQAKAAAIAAAMPDSVFTFGASAAARTAAIGAIIMGALQVAKSALKGMIGGKSGKSADSSGSGAASTSSGSIRVKQRAEGKYDVVGADDGRTYRNVPYTGIAKTGVVAKPTLMGERGSELVISHPDFVSLQRHVNFPMILEAIQDARYGRVPQRAAGKYNSIDQIPSASDTSSGSNNVMLLLVDALNRFTEKDMTPVIGASQLQAELDKYNREQKRFSQK